MTDVKNIFQPIAEKLMARAVELNEAGADYAAKATPFARSLIAARITGVSTAMIESMIVAAAGSPKGANGKTVKGVSGLRNVEGGASTYQTFKTVTRIADAMLDPTPYAGTDKGLFIVEAVEASEGVEAVEASERPFTIGELLEPIVQGFIVADKDAPKSLHALSVAVAATLTAHSKAAAAAAGVTEKKEGEGEADASPPASLLEQATGFLAMLRAQDDNAFSDAQEALAMISDYIDSRWEALAASLEAETPPVAAAA